MLPEMERFLVDAENVFRGLRLPKVEHLVLDWAGIGDAVHARLIAQHVARQGATAWITNPLVAGLYRDDPLPVLPGVASPWRDPMDKNLRQMAPAMTALAERIFGQPVLDVSAGVTKFFPAWLKQPTNYADLFFTGAGVVRDMALRHTLVHHGKPLSGHYVVIETTSRSHGRIGGGYYAGLIQKLNARGVAALTIGGLVDELAVGSLDYRGRDLYDTFSLIKGARAFVGRASGCQSLVYFLPDMPLFEVDVPEWGSARVCNYHQATSIGKHELDRLAEVIR